MLQSTPLYAIVTSDDIRSFGSLPAALEVLARGAVFQFRKKNNFSDRKVVRITGNTVFKEPNAENHLICLIVEYEGRKYEAQTPT